MACTCILAALQCPAPFLRTVSSGVLPIVKVASVVATNAMIDDELAFLSLFLAGVVDRAHPHGRDSHPLYALSSPDPARSSCSTTFPGASTSSPFCLDCPSHEYCELAHMLLLLCKPPSARNHDVLSLSVQPAASESLTTRVTAQSV